MLRCTHDIVASECADRRAVPPSDARMEQCCRTPTMKRQQRRTAAAHGVLLSGNSYFTAPEFALGKSSNYALRSESESIGENVLECGDAGEGSAEPGTR